jgi:hypothetical protein
MNLSPEATTPHEQEGIARNSDVTRPAMKPRSLLPATHRTVMQNVVYGLSATRRMQEREASR